MQKQDGVVIRKPSVTLCHFLANKNLDSRIKPVDLHVIFGNSRLLTNRSPTADKHRQQSNDCFFHIIPPVTLVAFQTPRLLPHASTCSCGSTVTSNQRSAIVMPASQRNLFKRSPRFAASGIGLPDASNGAGLPTWR